MVGNSARQMKLIAFMQACNSSNFPASWRHPESQGDFLSPEYFQRIARTLEDGKFHLAFFDDRLAMPEYGDSHVEAVRYGIRVVRMDLTAVLMTMAAVTSRLGLGATFSTTYQEPFHTARMFATLDLMTRGRAAWNVVTSINDSEAMNFGRDHHMDRDLRYDRADEFLEVVTGHWDTWEDDAIIQDKETSVFADPAKVHPLEYKGKFFKSRGPFTVPRSPQGHPVLLQAGQSGRGVQFAARWGELVFVTNQTLEIGQKKYAELKEAAAALGRDPDKINVAQACYVVVGETESLAREKRKLIDDLVHPIDTLVMMGDRVNLDLAGRDLDAPLNDTDLAAMATFHKIKDHALSTEGRPNPSLREMLKLSGRATITEFPVFCGTPKSVADEMEQWFNGRACDGFVLAATHMPGAYEDFVRLVVPQLQKRGIFHKDYAGTTLRENLGLPKAKIGAWKR